MNVLEAIKEAKEGKTIRSHAGGKRIRYFKGELVHADNELSKVTLSTFQLETDSWHIVEKRSQSDFMLPPDFDIQSVKMCGLNINQILKLKSYYEEVSGKKAEDL